MTQFSSALLGARWKIYLTYKSLKFGELGAMNERTIISNLDAYRVPRVLKHIFLDVVAFLTFSLRCSLAHENRSLSEK